MGYVYTIARLEREKLVLETMLVAARIELGRHLCYTNLTSQKRFWDQVDARAKTELQKNLERQLDAGALEDLDRLV